MNFTREPIIETIITPRDGYKLILRANRGDKEFSVDAAEVVNFGNALFFRSTERPKSFLLPVAEYEVVETRETRVVLKNASLDKSVKIAGGKEANSKEEKADDDTPKESKKRERRRARRRRVTTADVEEGEEVAPAKIFTGLIPPPSNLISESFPPTPAPDLFKDQIGDNASSEEKESLKDEKPIEDLTPEEEKGQPILPPFQDSDKIIPVIAPPPMPSSE